MKTEGFPKSQRLLKRAEFVLVLRKGTAKTGENLIIYRLSSPNQGRKFGFLVKKKVGKAAKRNRAKRWLREIVRKNKDKFGLNEMVVIEFKSGLEDVDYHILEKEILSLIG